VVLDNCPIRFVRGIIVKIVKIGRIGSVRRFFGIDRVWGKSV